MIHILTLKEKKLGYTSSRSYAYQLKLLLRRQGSVLRGSGVKCSTRNPGVLGSSRTESSRFYRRSVLGQDISELKHSTGETRKDMN